MASFKEMVTAPAGSKFVVQGNAAFALGVIHSGYHAATGYPGTPSTEVIDKSLALVQDRIKVGWSVNEAVAVSTGLGHAMAGCDAVVTMKIPGVFQAADAISTTAFFTGRAGALVIFAVTDYAPSSTQHVIDARYFFASAGLPVLEPRDHQELYEIAWTAADLSRRFNTPVVVLASGLLAHSEALIATKEPRVHAPLELLPDVKAWMLLPTLARANYNKVVRERIPALKQWGECSDLATVTEGSDDWGIIVNGANELIVREALLAAGAHPWVLSLALANPLPEKQVKSFAARIKGKIIVLEEGGRFIEEKIRLLGLEVVGKGDLSTVTQWTPEEVLKFLSDHIDIGYKEHPRENALPPLPRPPSLCPGCLYRPFTLAVERLKKHQKLYAAFGDIGCSTLLYFFNALDTVSCMGASDGIRQGFVLSRPDMAHQVISVIGDSTECHSGLDATRNAVFRNVPGVKVILNNYTTAMTGGQPAPSSPHNLEGQEHRFSLTEAVKAEGGRTVVVNAFDARAVDKELQEALRLAREEVFSTVILEGECVHEVSPEKLRRTLEFDLEKCNGCGLCDVCPGIEFDDDKMPHFTSLCTNCAGQQRLCMQRCNRGAIVPRNDAKKAKSAAPTLPELAALESVHVDGNKLPKSLRVSVRGIGGQGNLFFGRVLSEVVLRTPYADTRIVKGETHGMAQLGGPVISTFSCGEVYSPVLTPQSVDALVVMERSEVLRPGFIDLLKPAGTIILNDFAVLPVNVKKAAYPSWQDLDKILSGYRVAKINALQLAAEIGDESGRSANVIVIGVLSTIEPFSAIPESVWQAAIQAVSPGSAKVMNRLAFERGRAFVPPLIKGGRGDS